MELYQLKEKMRKPAAILAMGVAALTLAACGEDVFKNGGKATITAHEYDDPDTWTSFVLIGKVMVPQVHYDPAHWYLDLKQCGRAGDSHADEKGCITGEIEVPQDYYDSVHDGEVIDLGPPNK
jgi:hypothetical protein